MKFSQINTSTHTFRALIDDGPPLISLNDLARIFHKKTPHGFFRSIKGRAALAEYAQQHGIDPEDVIRINKNTHAPSYGSYAPIEIACAYANKYDPELSQDLNNAFQQHFQKL